MSFTLVSFHAHPDDEALLTAGTLARLAAEGHRVVLVVATAGEAGLTSSRVDADSLGERRLAELRVSAAALGCARVICLDYADSGMPDAPSGHPASFAAADLEGAARKLAAILTEENADALTSYDPAGGYGHFDHVQIHRVGARAAALAGTPLVLQATIDRGALVRVLRVLGWLYRIGSVGRRGRGNQPPTDFEPSRFAMAYTASAELTHRVDVRRFARQKRASMQAHVTQAATDSGDRTLAFCLRLPQPLFRLAFGHEWFVEVGRAPNRPLLDDVFMSLRNP